MEIKAKSNESSSLIASEEKDEDNDLGPPNGEDKTGATRTEALLERNGCEFSAFSFRLLLVNFLVVRFMENVRYLSVVRFLSAGN